MELITGEQRDELITPFVKRDAFHLELKDAYATAIEDGPFAKWLKGEPDDFTWLRPWQARIRSATQAGKVGEEIRWLPRGLLPRRDHLSRTLPGYVVEALLEVWADAVGTPATVLPTVEQVTGHPARTFAQWAADHADDFR